MKDTQTSTLVDLLREARVLHNLAVRDTHTVNTWHKRVDDVLAGFPGDDPAQRFDDPARQEHRRFINRLLKRG